MVKEDLENLPEKFRDAFLTRKRRIQKFGEVFYLADFSFLITEIIFSQSLEDENRETIAESSRELIYEIFDSQNFVDGKVEKIIGKQDEHLQTLFRHGIIYLWTSLETFIKDFVAELISFDRELLASDKLSNVDIPMAEYFSYDDSQKNEYLSELIIGQIKGRRRLGINRYESILDAFNLSGPFDSRYKKNIFLLHQIRNCIVHNDSVADKKFCDNCGFIGYDVGDEIIITKSDYGKYEKSVLAYMMEIYIRLNKRLGAPENYMSAIRKKYDEIFSTTND